jgi:TonB-dependent receptor
METYHLTTPAPSGLPGVSPKAKNPSIRKFITTTINLVMAVVLCSTMSLHTTAQNTGTVAALSGSVVDDVTDLPLEGVRVMISGTALQTFTDRYGDFFINNVPTGAQKVALSYVGYGTLRKEVSITTGQPNRLDVRYSDAGNIINLEPFIIQGALVGTARAINQQRAAETLTNVVASDEIGRFPDQNAAESLQRISGLSLYRDQGEGRYVVVRGMNYALNSIELNGLKLASPEEGDRGIALDVIPSDAIASIEVIKAPTPDMDGEGVGGSINIKTKSAFDYQGTHASLNVQGNYSALSGKWGQKINGTFSTILNSGNIGLIISPTYQTRKFGSYNYENDGWSEEESPTDGQDYYMLEAVNFRDYVIERKRYGVSFGIEGQPSSELYWFVHGTYDRFKDTELRFRTVIDFTEGDLTALDSTSATFEDLRRYRRDLRDRVKDQDLQALSAGFEWTSGSWAVDGKVGLSKGHEENPNETQFRFRHNDKDGVFSYNFSDPYNIKVVQSGGIAIEDPEAYELQRVEVTNDEGDEDEMDLMLNGKYDLDTFNPAYIKFGVAYRAKDKNKEVEAYEYSDGPDSFTFANLVGEVSDYPYYKVPRIDVEKIRAAFWPNLSTFEAERVFEDSELDDWDSSEDVLAGYVMGSVKMGNTTFVGGVRIEKTYFETTGKNVDLEEEQVLGLFTQSHDYSNVLPSLHVRHELCDNIMLRASFSKSLARPSFGDSAARLAINNDDEEVFLGNPNLDALESNNFDASVEYYLPSLGVISAAVFYKDIKNFSYEIVVDGGYASLPDYELTTFENGSDGKIQGIELAYQQQLTMLPGPFDGLGVLVNATFSSSEANYPTRPGEKLDFIGNSDEVVNLALTYEKGGFFARLAMNYRSERLREDEVFGGDLYEDIWVDDQTQYDLMMSYRINDTVEIFGEWVNITNEPFKVFFKSPNGQPNRLGQFEEYDWSANFGVRLKL